MRYVKPYTYFVGKPGGMANLLWGVLALLTTAVIPVLGQVVLLGYRAEVAEDLAADPDIADYRDFRLNRFVEYLARGVWPLLMQLLVGLVVAALIVLAAGVGVAVAFATEKPDVGLIVGGVLLVPLVLLGAMLIWPLELHTQLSRGFHFGAALRFTGRTLRRLGGQLFFSLVAHGLISVAIFGVGMAPGAAVAAAYWALDIPAYWVVLAGVLVVVWTYPAAMVTFMAQEHFMIQLYRLYLDEGGEPIRGPVEDAEMGNE